MGSFARRLQAIGLVKINAFGANSHQPFVTTRDCEESIKVRFRKPTSVAWGGEHCVTRACHGYLVIDRHMRRNLLYNGDYYFTFNVIVDIIFRDAFVRVSVPVVIHILDSRSLFKHR